MLFKGRDFQNILTSSNLSMEGGALFRNIAGKRVIDSFRIGRRSEKCMRRPNFKAFKE